MTKPQESLPLAPTGEADAAYYNLWLRIDNVKDGVMTNKACAKLAFGQWLEPCAPIVFEIISGSAVFEDGSRKKTATTDSFGLAILTFADTKTDSGEMTATMQSNPNVSSKAPYAFTGSTGLNVMLLSIKDGEPADGTSEDQGRAVVTENGGALQAAQIVQFQFANGTSATFDVNRPGVQSGSTGTLLKVMTHFDETSGLDFADVWFTDAVGETVTLEASLVSDPAFSPQTLDFAFIATQAYGIALKALTDGQPADGNAENAGRAVVTQNGGALTQSQTVRFEFLSGAASFDTTKPNVVQSLSDSRMLYVTTDSEQGQDVADAYFTDAQVEDVEVRAFLDGHPEVKPKIQNFTFTAIPTYQIALKALTDDKPADGNAENAGHVVVTQNGGALTQSQTVRFEFLSGAASFDTTKPNVVQSLSDSRLLYVTTDSEQGQDVADAYFTDTQAEAVEVRASLYNHPEIAPKTQNFTFTAIPTYEIALNALTDDQSGDGSAENAGRVVVTQNGGSLTQSQTVRFEFLSGAASFDTTKPNVVQSLSDSRMLYVTTESVQGQDLADAYFTDTQAEEVEVRASLYNHPEVEPKTQDFTFTANQTFRIALSALTDNQPADGSSEDAGRAVVTENGGKLTQPQIVKFEFEMGASSSFDTTKPAGYVQPNSSPTVLYVKTHFDDGAQKDIADAYFTDSTAEAITLAAYLDDEPQAQPQGLGFEFAAPGTYFLGLSSMTPDGVPADGISENLGQAIVSCGGSGLPGPQTVKFELPDGGTFDTRGADVLPNSNGSTLYVKTHNDGRQDVAYAYFTASSPGPSTLQASLPDHPQVDGRSVDFAFRSPPWPYAIALGSLTLDGVPADGQSENHAQVVVTYGGKPMGHTLVKFELDGAWAAKFDTNKPNVQSGSTATTMTVSTYTDEQGRDVADAYFTDTSAEKVKLKASFPEYTQQGTSPAWRYFFFSTSGDK